ncbi:hypothetical protein [Labedaea rhizosphaerae]|uniref:Uncharacterized protein n=1 Tax=Labedaea rhizosphaerae TaxID=598644 RepID=A0A4R6SNW7_LABRH|nr:hypothetical protein [Labedaea rhizosphaerae]TDQ05704.1 hypothetical protein EV186_1011682 [Labedaea rhizosphaerae]
MAHIGRVPEALDAASWQMQNVVATMIDKESLTDARFGEVSDARTRHWGTVTSLNLDQLGEEYERLVKVAQEITASDDAKKYLAQTISHLEGWVGDAKDAFVGQVSLVESFLDTQATNAWVAVRGIGTLMTLVYQAQESMFGIWADTFDAATNEIEDRDKKDIEVQIALGGEIASHLITLDVARWKSMAVDLVLKEGQILATDAIDGGDADKVIDTYIRTGDRVCREFEGGLEMLVKELMFQESGFSAQSPDLFAPLSTKVQIDSPDFTYEGCFECEEMPPNAFDPKVRKAQTAHRKHESDIEKRLGGAS